jgi:glutathione S-transferase
MIRVHRIPFSTNVERVALAAGFKGVGIEWVDHRADDRSAVIELSGQSLVPVAEFDGEVVRGSMRIVDRIERDHPEPTLYPGDAADRARALIFTAFFDRVWKGPPNALDGPPPPDADALAKRLRGWTGWFEDLLATDDYLGGESLGIADVCAFPFLKYATLDPEPDDPETFHVVLAEHLQAAPGSKLAAWIDRVDALPRA